MLLGIEVGQLEGNAVGTEDGKLVGAGAKTNEMHIKCMDRKTARILFMM